MTVRVKNVSPLGDLEVPLLGAGVVVAAGEELDVPDDVAGVEPTAWAPVTDPRTFPYWLTRVDDSGELLGYTPGTGLLGTGNFERVALTIPTSTPTDTADQAATTNSLGD